MTALEIANDTMLSLGLDEVDTLIGGSSEGKSLRVHLNRGGQALLSMRGAFGQGWPSATRRYEFTGVSGQSFYPLPADFISLVPGTMWDVTDGWEAHGPLTPYENTVVRDGISGGITVGTLYRQSEQDGQIGLTIYPEPTAGQEFGLEYVSRLWVRESEGSTPTLSKVARDTQVPIFPEHLVSLDLSWRYQKQLGEDFELLLAEFELERDRQFGQVLPMRTIRLGGEEPTYEELAGPPVVI